MVGPGFLQPPAPNPFMIVPFLFFSCCRPRFSTPPPPRPEVDDDGVSQRLAWAYCVAGPGSLQPPPPLPTPRSRSSSLPRSSLNCRRTQFSSRSVSKFDDNWCGLKTGLCIASSVPVPSSKRPLSILRVSSPPSRGRVPRPWHQQTGLACAAGSSLPCRWLWREPSIGR